MNCQHCGNDNRAQAKVCARCGHRLTAPADEAPDAMFEDEKTDPNLRVRTVGGIMATVVFVMAATMGAAAALLSGEHPYAVVPMGVFVFVYIVLASMEGSGGMPRALAASVRTFMQRLRSWQQPMLGVAMGLLAGMIVNNVRMVPPPTVEDAQEEQRSEADHMGGDFPKRLPAINAQLAEAARLLDISKVAAADAQLAAVEETLQPVLNSSYRSFADVVDVQKRLAVVKARALEAHGEVELAAQRRKLAQVGRQLDEVDDCLRTRRFPTASKVWAWQQTAMTKFNHPALLASQEWTDTQKRMTQQKAWITAGLSGHPLPMSEIMPKKRGGKQRRMYSSVPQ